MKSKIAYLNRDFVEAVQKATEERDKTVTKTTEELLKEVGAEVTEHIPMPRDERYIPSEETIKDLKELIEMLETSSGDEDEQVEIVQTMKELLDPSLIGGINTVRFTDPVKQERFSKNLERFAKRFSEVKVPK